MCHPTLQGLDELKPKFSDDRASFAYVRITYANDKESTRDKFILITWIGSNVRVMRKAKLSVHKSNVVDVLRSFSVEVSANSLDDLAEEPIVVRLRKAGEWVLCSSRKRSKLTRSDIRAFAGGASYDKA